MAGQRTHAADHLWQQGRRRASTKIIRHPELPIIVIVESFAAFDFLLFGIDLSACLGHIFLKVDDVPDKDPRAGNAPRTALVRSFVYVYAKSVCHLAYGYAISVCHLGVR
mmetsp:Transcript_48140/g.112440  ORF Transcript_48140/g.112440 Transcript_48140/m.112440 type:complete len:110 (-) Transcript_48140:74-403(-)